MASKRYTLDEYISYLKTYIGRVKFPEIHVHATWKPSIADYKRKGGESLVEAMRRVHINNGWGNIAQHVTIDPDGYIWNGRSLLVPPASATGHNDGDNDNTHPFMFEMIGNFDVGAEKLEGAQLNTAVGLTKSLVNLFESQIVFHREINNTGKTCPGSGVDKADFVAKVNVYGISREDDDVLELTDSQWTMAKDALQRLNDEKVFSDKSWIDKADKKQLTISELSWLNLIVMSRK